MRVNVLQTGMLAVGLSMDACAAAVGRGLAAGRASPGQCLACGAWFGGFQALMPVIGFFLGGLFAGTVRALDHWAVLFLLTLIGVDTIRQPENSPETGDFSPKALLVPAFATSIDALAVGISLRLAGTERIWPAALLIGTVTAALSDAGVTLGSRLGSAFGRKARIFGGGLLIFLGVKIFLEHVLS